MIVTDYNLLTIRELISINKVLRIEYQINDGKIISGGFVNKYEQKEN